MKIIVLFVVENIQNSRQRPEASADPSMYQITDSSLPNVEHRTDGKYFSYYMNFMNFMNFNCSNITYDSSFLLSQYRTKLYSKIA